MALVVQVKTEDNCKEVSRWIRECFGILKAQQNCGIQDFAKIAGEGATDSPAVGKMPYDGNTNEMIVQTSITDMDKLVLAFCLKTDPDISKQQKSLRLIANLIRHKGEGSLYSCLKEKNYISGLDIDNNNMMVTAFRFVTVEITLTELGLENYKKIIAVIFEYFKIVKDQWLAGKGIQYFKEI